MEKPLNIPFLVQVTTSEKGKCCDMFPPNSIHLVQEDENGLKCVGRRSSWVHDFVEVAKIPEGTPMKKCSLCTLDYSNDTPFINSMQRGEVEMCLTCYEKRHVAGDRYEYRELIRKQVLSEIKIVV